MLWLKALHIIFVVCWFAGLFYLPRLFVNYAGNEHPEVRQQLAEMSRKLYRFITPFMLIAIGFGLALIASNAQYYLESTWMQVKLAGVLMLVVYHLQCGRYVQQLLALEPVRSHIFFRIFNEVPVLFLFGIVILAVVKPF